MSDRNATAEEVHAEYHEGLMRDCTNEQCRAYMGESFSQPSPEPRTAAGRCHWISRCVDDAGHAPGHIWGPAIEAEATGAEGSPLDVADKARQYANEHSRVHEWPGGTWLQEFAAEYARLLRERER